MSARCAHVGDQLCAESRGQFVTHTSAHPLLTKLLASAALWPDVAFTVRVFFTSLALALTAGVAIGFHVVYGSVSNDAPSLFVTASSLPTIVLMPLRLLPGDRPAVDSSR